MSDVVIYDPLDAIVPNRVTEFLQSRNTPAFEGNPNTLINPPITATLGEEFWKFDGVLTVIDMTQPEIDLIIADRALQRQTDGREDGIAATDNKNGVGYQNRGLIGTYNKRDNFVINRLIELQDAMDAMKGSVGDADALRAAIPASFLPTATQDRPAAIQAYEDEITSGDADPNAPLARGG